MRNLKSSKMIGFKAGLLLLIGIVSAVLLLVETPTVRCGVLLVLTIWAFCRAYYFAFYVIEHYVDPGYHFSGLWSFLVYLCRRNPTSSRRLG